MGTFIIKNKFRMGNTNLNRNWTNLIANKFSMVNSFCVLKFKNYWIQKNPSRKVKSSFFQASAVCKFSNCYSFYFTIKDDVTSLDYDSTSNIPVHYRCEGIFSSEHSDGMNYARHVSGSERQKMGENLMQNTTTNTFHKQFNSVDNFLEFNNGNFNNLKSQNCLRQIKSEFKSKTRFSNNDMLDIIATQKYFRLLLP